MAQSGPALIRQGQARFRALDRRDQLALISLGGFLAVLIFVFGIWIPANDFRESQASARDRQFELVQYMRSTEQEARTLGDGSARAPSGQNLLTQISRSARQYNISPNRLQPEGEGVSVSFEDVAFDSLIQWLQAQSEEGIRVRQLSVAREDAPGLVNARILLEG